jgi:hypothetical protein
MGERGTSERTRFCHCNNERVSVWDCDGCPDDSWLDDDRHEDPPLYASGYLAGLTLEQLEKESSRQAGVQGTAGDNLDRPGIEAVIENAEARWRLVESEIKRRKETNESAPSPRGGE